MATHDIHEAKTGLSRPVDDAVKGERGIIAQACEHEGKQRKFGDNFLGISYIAPDFYDDLPPETFEALRDLCD